MRTLDEMEYERRRFGFIEDVRRVAFLYVRVTQDPKEIAQYMCISEQRVKTYAKSTVCLVALAQLGHQGHCVWANADDPRHPKYLEARGMYETLIQNWDKSKDGSLLKHISEELGIGYSTVQKWSRGIWSKEGVDE